MEPRRRETIAAEVSGGKQAEMEQVIFERLGQAFSENDLILLKFSIDRVVFP
ncbi:MAG: hypothetical protein WA821_01525 [Anaerolineales bacterium]